MPDDTALDAALDATASAAPTRRTVLTAAGAGLTLTACGGSGGAGGSSSGSQPGSGGAPGAAVAPLADVPVGQSKTVKVPGGKTIVLARPSEGEVKGFSAICTHQGCTVRAAGADLDCPCHGSKFDAMTGEVKQGPAAAPLDPVAVTVDGDEIRLA